MTDSSIATFQYMGLIHNGTNSVLLTKEATLLMKDTRGSDEHDMTRTIFVSVLAVIYFVRRGVHAHMAMPLSDLLLPMIFAQKQLRGSLCQLTRSARQRRKRSDNEVWSIDRV